MYMNIYLYKIISFCTGTYISILSTISLCRMMKKLLLILNVCSGSLMNSKHLFAKCYVPVQLFCYDNKLEIFVFALQYYYCLLANVKGYVTIYISLLNCIIFTCRNQNGAWSDDGVHITEVAEDHIVCSSDHLTSFTVLATTVSWVYTVTMYVHLPVLVHHST